MASQPDFVLLGPTGFLGEAILRALKDAGHTVVTSRVRLQDRTGINSLLDESPPSIGVICAAGERGRPNIAWCDSHPVETVDANITGQLNVAAACHARGLHVILLGTGALYSVGEGGAAESRPFTEDDPPNAKMGVYLDLRKKMEDLLVYFDNTLVLRILYPVSSDLDPRGLVGKLARFEKVFHLQTSVTVLDDLCPMIPQLSKSKAKGVLNFVNKGVLGYADVITELSKRAPEDWRRPQLDPSGSNRSACELDVTRLAAAAGCEVPEASAAVQRIISRLSEDELRKLSPES